MKEETYRTWDVAIKFLGGLGLLGTLWWTIQSFYATRQKEMDFTAWSRKYEVYSNLADRSAKVSVLVSAPLQTTTQARNDFWQIYLGPFQVVSADDDEVRRSAQVFADGVMASDSVQTGDVAALSPFQLQAKAQNMSKAIGEALKEV
jgi:hypothetical protein